MNHVHGTKLIAAGDMNELGDLDDPQIFQQLLFPEFGELHLSSALQSCCSDSKWRFRFDRILANFGDIVTSSILSDGRYPVNPGYDGHSEEHKAIYGLVKF
jgi:hypothetical protein